MFPKRIVPLFFVSSFIYCGCTKSGSSNNNSREKEVAKGFFVSSRDADHSVSLSYLRAFGPAMSLNWKKDFPGAIAGGPGFLDDLLFFNSAYDSADNFYNKLYCVDLQTGSEKWEHQSQRPFGTIYDGKLYGLGPPLYECDPYTGVVDSFPVNVGGWSYIQSIEANTMYTITYELSPKFTVSAFDMTSKNLKWTTIFTYSSVLGNGGGLYIMSSTAELTCVNKSDGSVKWRTNEIEPRGTGYTRLNETGNILYYTVDGSITAFDVETGHVIWQWKIGNAFYRICGTPYFYEGKLYASAIKNNAVYSLVCLNATTGEIIWQKEATETLEQGVAVAGEGIYAYVPSWLGNDSINRLFVYDLNTGIAKESFEINLPGEESAELFMLTSSGKTIAL